MFLAGNNNTLNPTEGTDGSIPLFTDSALTDGLTAGDYYLAVADGSNTPSPLEGQMPGSPGIFDPNQPGSAQLGWSTGPYVLNLLVQPTPDPPPVLASSPSSGQVLDQAPTQLTVQFSEPINIQQLAFQAFETSYQPDASPGLHRRGPTGRGTTRDSCLTIARRTRPRSRCSTAWRMARTPCTSRDREV